MMATMSLSLLNSGNRKTEVPGGMTGPSIWWLKEGWDEGEETIVRAREVWQYPTRPAEWVMYLAVVWQQKQPVEGTLSQ
jgi:hypothetical protein